MYTTTRFTLVFVTDVYDFGGGNTIRTLYYVHDRHHGSVPGLNVTREHPHSRSLWWTLTFPDGVVSTYRTRDALLGAILDYHGDL